MRRGWAFPLWSPAALALAACHQTPASPSAPGVSLASLGTVAAKGSPYALYRLIRPSEDQRPVPPLFDDAAAEFERGRAAYEERQAYPEAAEHFLLAATKLEPPPDARYAGAFAADRAWAYKNAAAAWAMAGAPVEAKRRLEAAATADPQCAGDIRDVLQQLFDSARDGSTRDPH